MPPERRKRKLAAILSADAAGYSRLMGEDEGRTLDTLKAHLATIGSGVAGHRGRVVAVHGDNLLAEFESVVDAVRCAIEIQKGIAAKNEELPERSRMRFRIGINLGDVIEEQGSIYGDGVNVAARLEGLADPGGICISRSVWDQVRNKLGAEFRSIGAHGVKNIAEPVHAYRVVTGPDAFGKTAGRAWQWLEGRRKAALAVVLLATVGGIALGVQFHRRASSPGYSALSGQDAPPLPDQPSIAVLPFENMTGDPRQEFFADGFTEQIISCLSKIPTLFVISRNSMFTYKGKAVKVRTVGRELGVRYVLEGSVQRSGERLRINAQLIDAGSERHVWAESYDRSRSDIFALQDDVILRILTALQVKLTSGEQARVWAKGTKSLEAFLKFMQSRQYLIQMNKESNFLARRLAEETIALDPGYADAYALLGVTYHMEVFLGTSRPRETVAKAIELTQKALSMNGALAEARSALGVLYSWSGRHDEGVAEAERGVELDPNSGQANIYLAQVLRYAGRSKEAIPVIRKALRVEPIAPDIYVQNLALAHFQAGDCGEAVAVCEKGLTRQPDNLNSRAIRAAVYGFCGREAEARKEAGEVLRINPKFTAGSYAKILPYKNPSDRERTLQGLRKAGLP